MRCCCLSTQSKQDHVRILRAIEDEFPIFPGDGGYGIIRTNCDAEALALREQYVANRSGVQRVGVEAAVFLPNQETQGVKEVQTVLCREVVQDVAQETGVAVVAADVDILARQVAAAISGGQDLLSGLRELLVDRDMGGEAGALRLPSQGDGPGETGGAPSEDGKLCHGGSPFLI